MITPAYCSMMARYNSWQNSQLTTALDKVSAQELTAERGAFFGSILGTLNHILWADRIWMSRFDASFAAPEEGIPESPALCPDYTAWKAARGEMDRWVEDWATQVTQSDLSGDLAWYSGAAGRDVTRPRAFCVTHMFNHQTHHRGQLHAMMTNAALVGNTSDLFLVPEAL